MGWLSFLSKPQEQVALEYVTKSTWRTGMWVISPHGIGILVSLGTPCVVDAVDSNGVTTQTLSLNMAELRQAYWAEIPEIRRSCSQEQGKLLGYL